MTTTDSEFLKDCISEFTTNSDYVSQADIKAAEKMYSIVISKLPNLIKKVKKPKKPKKEPKLKRCEVCHVATYHPYSKEHRSTKRHQDFLLVAPNPVTIPKNDSDFL